MRAMPCCAQVLCSSFSPYCRSSLQGARFGRALRPSRPSANHHCRDIDRFARAVLEGWVAGSDGSGGSGDGAAAVPAAKQPGAAAMMGAAVAASRVVCRLPSRIGAAPVVYGIPCLVRPIEQQQEQQQQQRRPRQQAKSSR